MEEVDRDRIFAPLLMAVDSLGLSESEWETVMSSYMFIQESPDRFAYKHQWSREYVYIDEAGVVLSGSIDTIDYSPSPLQGTKVAVDSDN